MTSEFAIFVPNWFSGVFGQEEVCQTSTSLRIVVNKRVATRVYDELSKSVRDEVFVSAYPLALWFAASWWRLRWELAPKKNDRGVDWRLAHEMAAAGHGFIWPRLVFESDGETIDVISRSTATGPTEPVRFLENFRESISAEIFEHTVDGFFELVLARLAAIGEQSTELQQIWQDLVAERNDAEAAIYRRLEAQMGFDPDEAPEVLMQRLVKLSGEAGLAATSELAPILSGQDPEGALANVLKIAHSEGMKGNIKLLPQIPQLLGTAAYQDSEPWERGRLLAERARAGWGVKSDSVDDNTLNAILGLDYLATQPSHDLPLGIAIRNGSQSQLRFVFCKRKPMARRFEAARLLADNLTAPSADHWLPATDTKTARQKVQRAFAAEFLCPIGELTKYMDQDFSDDAIERAGDHFGVPPLAVESQLANHDLIPKF